MWLVELKFEDGTSEICQYVKQFSNGDLKLERKGKSRLEFMSRHYESELSYLAKKANIWIESYLKDTKGYIIVRARLFKGE